VDGVKQLGDVLASRGITFVFAVAPNKATIYPEETIDLIANSDAFILALVERTFMGTDWYHEPDYRRRIESAINQGIASRH